MIFSKPSPVADEKVIDEWLSRGIEHIFPNTEALRTKLKKGERITIYLGVDPTGPTLHLGHVIPLRKLGQLQRMGHGIILLIGDFTAMIGDPTDKSAVRKKLSAAEVKKNLTEYKKQASKFISFSGANKAEIKFNSSWLAPLSFAEILELTSLVTVDQMLKRDMFQRRQEEGKPIHIHEFLYPLMQGYDSVAMDVDAEIGGNDQTFNMLTGRDLLKILKNKEKFVITTKLLTDSTGKKMGKTENNMVALDQTPEDMFGRIMSWSDALIIPGFELATDVSLEEIEKMKTSMEQGANPRDFKKKLALDIVSQCHTEALAAKAAEQFEQTFAKGEVPEDIVEVSREEVADKLVSQGVIESKSELRRLVEAGAVSSMTTGAKIESIESLSSPDTYKIGKRRFIKVI